MAKISDTPLPPAKAPSLVVIGLDGATWDIISPLLQSGEMPNLEKLLDRGSSGILRSLDPMDSPCVWSSIETGLPLDQHGVEGFFSTRLDLKAPRIWDVAASHGQKIGLCSWLMTWPVVDSFEFVIPAWMARSPETYPSAYAAYQEIALEQGLRGSFHPWRSLWRCALNGARLSGIRPVAGFYLRDLARRSEEERYADQILSEVDLQTDLFLHLLRRHPVDIAAFTLYGTDKIAHRFWHCMSPGEFNLPDTRSPFLTVIQDYYKKVDRALGRIVHILPDSCRFVVLSDHGMKADTALPRQFFLDTPRLLSALQVEGFVHHTALQREVILTPDSPQALPQMAPLAESLESVLFSESEEPVFQVQQNEQGAIHLRPNFSLTWNEESPLLQEPDLQISGKRYPTRDFFYDRTFSGTHDPEGILVLSGPGITTGATVQDAGLLDIAPTLLYLLDLPISRELSGRILTEAISPDDFPPPVYVDNYPPPRTVESPAPPEEDSFLERLESVGYTR